MSGQGGKGLPGYKPVVPDKGYIRAFELFATSKCRNCGRTLRADVSIKRGFGSTCAAEFAGRYLSDHPGTLGERARKLWTHEEVNALVDHAKAQSGRMARATGRR